MNHTDIQKLIDTHPIIIFGKGEKGEPHCGFTAGVQAVFEELGIDYHMVNILADQDLRAEMKVFSDWPTFPQVYANGEFLGGCDIVVEMAQQGQLQVD